MTNGSICRMPWTSADARGSLLRAWSPCSAQTHNEIPFQGSPHTHRVQKILYSDASLIMSLQRIRRPKLYSNDIPCAADSVSKQTYTQTVNTFGIKSVRCSCKQLHIGWERKACTPKARSAFSPILTEALTFTASIHGEVTLKASAPQSHRFQYIRHWAAEPPQIEWPSQLSPSRPASLSKSSIRSRILWIHLHQTLPQSKRCT